MLNEKSRLNESVVACITRIPLVIPPHSNVAGNIVAVLEDIYTKEKRIFKIPNIVTDAGDLYYAQLGASESTTNAFGIMELGSAGAAPGKTSNRSNITTKIATSQKAFDGTYPKTNDGDADNTGAGTDVVSYLVSYAAGEANDAAIDRVFITNVTPGASEPLLMYAALTAFEKTSSDTLKMFVNHTMLGV